MHRSKVPGPGAGEWRHRAQLPGGPLYPYQTHRCKRNDAATENYLLLAGQGGAEWPFHEPPMQTLTCLQPENLLENCDT